MKPMDNVKKWLDRICGPDSEKVLFEEEKKEWDGLTETERKRYLEELLTKPVLFENPAVIYFWYFRTKWADALKLLHDSSSISVLEIGAGGCDIVPKTISKTYDADSEYVTANLNKELSSILKAITQNLPINICIIEDDAQRIEDYAEENSFDVIVFEHSVNDVIENLLASKNNIDTINTSWMEVLPSISEIVNREYKGNTYEENAKKEFLEIISSCLSVLKPGGYIACCHYQFQYNLDIGLDPYLNENILNIVRKWIAEAGLGTEVFFDGFDSQYWMFIKKS